MESPEGEPVTAGVDDEDIPDEDKDLDYYIRTVADEFGLKAGYRGFSYSGPGATGSRPTWYTLANSFSLSVAKTIMPRIYYGLDAGVLWGKTQELRGSFLGYDLGARVFWEDDWEALSGLIQKWQAGAHGSLSGLGVSGEGFGGLDGLQGGVFAGLRGLLEFDERVRPWSWFGRFSLTPLTLGRIGYDNGNHLLRSSFGWELSLGGYQITDSVGPQWGAGLSLGSLSLFDDAGNSTTLAEYSLSLLMRWSL